jgi:hypothetical protein
MLFINGLTYPRVDICRLRFFSLLTPGMVGQKVFCIRIRAFVQAHRIALHRFIAFAFLIHIKFLALFHLSALFLIFLLHVSQLVHQKVVKSAKKT